MADLFTKYKLQPVNKVGSTLSYTANNPKVALKLTQINYNPQPTVCWNPKVA